MVRLSTNQTCLEFIRHGLPQGGNRYRGSGIDDELSSTGWEQMWSAMNGDTQWDVVVSSPLLRCRQFADAFASEHGLSVELDAELREIGFGAWEGKTRQQLLDADANSFNRFYQDPVKFPPQGAEPVEDFRARVEHALNNLLESHAGERVLVVAHAGIMRAVLSIVLHSPASMLFRAGIPNAMRMTLMSGPPLSIRF